MSIIITFNANNSILFTSSSTIIWTPSRPSLRRRAIPPNFISRELQRRVTSYPLDIPYSHRPLKSAAPEQAFSNLQSYFWTALQRWRSSPPHGQASRRKYLSNTSTRPPLSTIMYPPDDIYQTIKPLDQFIVHWNWFRCSFTQIQICDFATHLQER